MSLNLLKQGRCEQYFSGVSLAARKEPGATRRMASAESVSLNKNGAGLARAARVFAS
jgi:hypothetical protein